MLRPSSMTSSPFFLDFAEPMTRTAAAVLAVGGMFMLQGCSDRPLDQPGEVVSAPGGEALIALANERAPTARQPFLTYDTLASQEAGSQDWLTYSGAYNGWRHSSLDAITPDNVGRLSVQWVFQAATLVKIEATPIVRDGVMYLTVPPDPPRAAGRGGASKVVALDASTGQPFWTFERRPPAQLTLCCGPVNRGVALMGDAVFVGTIDAHLIALDSRTGELLWDTELADHRTAYSTTSAPLAVKDMVITGVAGGEFGIRGFIDAYDASTGQLRWRWNAIPGPGEADHETWGGDGWQTGAAPTWGHGSFDPETNLVYWGVGHPGPDFDGRGRPGDNLYSNSVVALDADTGTLVWYYQFSPHGTHDWDSTQIPILIDAAIAEEDRRLLVWANRNAFYYVLDRETGDFLGAVPFARQSWADGFDSTGRPIVRRDTEPTEEGTVVSPSSEGATNWWPPSYSPRTGLVYVNSYDAASRYFLGESGIRGRFGLPRRLPGSGISRRSGLRVRELHSSACRDHWRTRVGVAPAAGSGTPKWFAVDRGRSAVRWHYTRSVPRDRRSVRRGSLEHQPRKSGRRGPRLIPGGWEATCGDRRWKQCVRVYRSRVESSQGDPPGR